VVDGQTGPAMDDVVSLSYKADGLRALAFRGREILLLDLTVSD